MTTASAYAELFRAHLRLHRYNHLAAIVGWDRNAMMPPGGIGARAHAEAELNTLIHRSRTDRRLADWLRAAEEEPLDDIQRANLREIRRDWRNANALPRFWRHRCSVLRAVFTECNAATREIEF